VPSELDAGADGADGQVPERRRICDGSSDVRLAVAYQATTSALPNRIVLLGDLGFEFLFVDGACHFWVQQPGATPDEYLLWRPYREGTLTASLEESLHVAAGYDDVVAAHECIGGRPIDAPVLTVWDGKGWNACDGSLAVPPNWPLRDQLFAIGAELDGPVRLQVKREIIAEDALVYEWPIESPIESYVVDYSEASSFRITDSDSVSRLRTLRDIALTEAAASPGYFSGAIAIKPSDSYVPGLDEAYMLIMRDELPFTDASGKWIPQ
jgi:hypothetical protein